MSGHHELGDLELLSELTGSAVVVLDDEASLVRTAGATTGPLEAVVAGDWRRMLADGDLVELTTVLADGNQTAFVHRLRLMELDRWVELRGQRRDGSWACVATDVTDEVHLEAELHQVRHILEATSDLVVVCDLDTGEVLWSNDTATVILGLAPGIPRGLGDIVPDGQIEALLEAVRVSGSWTGVIDLEPAPQYVVPCKVNLLRGARPADRRSTVSLIARDISDLRAIEGKLRWAADHDDLTGLANRGVLEAAIGELLRTLGPSSAPASVLALDLDGFKPVNDLHGHAAGDEVLRVVGHRLREAVRDGDLACRMGGDEFVVLARRVDGATARSLADRIVESVRQPVDVGAAEVSVEASVGIVELTVDLPDAGTALRLADEAMYEVKRRTQRSRRTTSEQAPGGLEVLGVGDTDPPLG